MRTRQEIRKQIENAYFAKLSIEEINLMHSNLTMELLLDIKDILSDLYVHVDNKD